MEKNPENEGFPMRKDYIGILDNNFLSSYLLMGQGQRILEIDPRDDFRARRRSQRSVISKVIMHHGSLGYKKRF